MTTEEKFYAAVNVIRNLPKNGAYQPSNELMLRFYAYYKQALEGPCQQPKPSFWEVVKKAKWDAWMRLGNMPRAEAMNNYVEELKKIVETMSYTENVADFLSSLDSFYESVPPEDLELLVGPVLERVRSQPGSPLSRSPIGSRETSPHRRRDASRHITSSLETSPASSHSASPLPPDSDGDEEEFIDTVESAPERGQKETSKATTRQQSAENAPEKEDSGESKSKSNDGSEQEFLARIAATMQNLQRDLDRITTRVRTLEGQALRAVAPQTDALTKRVDRKSWVSECSNPTVAFLILWPFVVQMLFVLIRRYRRRQL